MIPVFGVPIRTVEVSLMIRHHRQFMMPPLGTHRLQITLSLLIPAVVRLTAAVVTLVAVEVATSLETGMEGR
jgi:hypothetical protein